MNFIAEDRENAKAYVIAVDEKSIHSLAYLTGRAGLLFTDTDLDPGFYDLMEGLYVRRGDLDV